LRDSRVAREGLTTPPTISTQLDLWESELAVLPWRGQSPRGLTRIAKALFLRREPQKDDRFFVDPDQYDLFRAAKKRPPSYRGAPLLVPLPLKGDDHG